MLELCSNMLELFQHFRKSWNQRTLRADCARYGSSEESLGGQIVRRVLKFTRVLSGARGDAQVTQEKIRSAEVGFQLAMLESSNVGNMHAAGCSGLHQRARAHGSTVHCTQHPRAKYGPYTPRLSGRTPVTKFPHLRCWNFPRFWDFLGNFQCSASFHH